MKKLSRGQQRYILDLLDWGFTQKVLAEQFKVSQSTISRLKRGRYNG